MDCLAKLRGGLRLAAAEGSVELLVKGNCDDVASNAPKYFEQIVTGTTASFGRLLAQAAQSLKRRFFKRK
jgi:hypothetical protein